MNICHKAYIYMPGNHLSEAWRLDLYARWPFPGAIFRELRKAEVRRTPLPRTPLNKQGSDYCSSCPYCLRAALLSLGSGSGRSHNETWTGWTVLLATPTISFLSTSTSVSFRNRAEKVATVFAASYLRR